MICDPQTILEGPRFASPAEISSSRVPPLSLPSDSPVLGSQEGERGVRFYIEAGVLKQSAQMIQSHFFKYQIFFKD